VNSFPARFAVGWVIATGASVASLFITAKLDLPIGAAIVCALGVVLVLVVFWARLSRRFGDAPDEGQTLSPGGGLHPPNTPPHYSADARQTECPPGRGKDDSSLK